jgi:signal transduction histidine kinase
MPAIKHLRIRPYARLLTMLGEQLIKNERIALIELIKNSYDADSPWVIISFIGFTETFGIIPTSKIIIEDYGHGMSADIIEKHWLNPATPEKKRRKARIPTTPTGRVIQGDKGIGRFAILKLGRKINIITRATGEDVEHIVDYDFSSYDDDFLSEKGQDKDLFIDDLTISLQTRRPEYFEKGHILLGVRKIQRLPHGTRIEISNLKGSWSEEKVKQVYRDISRLESIFSEGARLSDRDRLKKNFSVWIFKDSKLQSYQQEYREKLNSLLTERAVLRVEEGHYDENKKELRFKINGVARILSIFDPRITGLNVFSKRFGNGGEELKKRNTECGPFQFGFYIFDFSTKAPAKYALDNEDKAIIRDHRIYLYRDGIRVYPYGEPEDDWLGIDIHRGTVSAAQFLSNDQVVGYVNITQKHNPKLKDKTNREGLLDEGNATDDFVSLIRTILRYIREHDYKKYAFDLQSKKKQDIFRAEQVLRGLNELEEIIKDAKTRNLLRRVQAQYKIERQYLVQRAETTEELAGVGLSVETASHDIMAIMSKALISIDGLIRDAMHIDLDKEQLSKELQSLRGMLSFIEAQLKDIQLLFKSSKQRRKDIRLKDTIEKVERIYRRLLKREGIAFSVREVGSPLVAKTTDAVLLQVLINLFDNAVYWLQQVSRKEKRIEILLDGNKGLMIFSDNGPGVNAEDAPYIFEPFYSAKGEEGRGLGLYIARQLLERNDYSIELAELKSERIMPGANFVVNFISSEDG